MKYSEGYIKFNLNWGKKSFAFSDEDFKSINLIRNKLSDLGLIGLYPDGIGFGNISFRQKNNQFIISGSATGGIKNLTKECFALVKNFDVEKNSVHCIGLIQASSESLSHGAIYKANRSVNAVIHVHHMAMWKQYLNDLPTTHKNAEFGTPEIAHEISKLANHDSGIIIMGGHPEGIITYGKNMDEAYKILIKYYNNI